VRKRVSIQLKFKEKAERVPTWRWVMLGVVTVLFFYVLAARGC